MTETLIPYKKENSFVTLRVHDPHRETLHRRLEALMRNLADYHLSDYQSEIVTRACVDLLGGQPGPDPDRFTLEDFIPEEVFHVSDADLPRYLFYRYRYEMFPRQKKVDKFPPCLQVEPASVCNYRCVFCYQTDKELTDPSKGHMGLMSFDLFKQVIDQAQGNIEAITLASRGEPTINRHFDEMLAYAAGKFLALKINTNAWYLEEAKCHAILQAGVNTLVFSADAAAEPLYSQLRVRGKLDRVLANIKLFQDIRTRHYPNSKTITRVSGVKFCDGQNIDDMEKAWGGLVDQVAFVQYNPWENTYERPFNDLQTPCSDLWRRMFVWWDGRVNPCDVDYKSTLSVGTAAQCSLSDLWTGEKYSALRDAHLEQRRSKLSLCGRCTVI